jgi:predicted nucleic acid-binding protein
MLYLADTNVLLRSAEPAHPMHPDAVRAVKTLLIRGETVCVFTQNLIEFWNVATRDANKNGLGFTTSQTEAEVSRIEELLMVVADSPAIYPEWRRLVVAHSVLGKQVHDARIAAAMIAHKVTHLLTFNTNDFKRFTSIIAISPQNIS